MGFRVGDQVRYKGDRGDGRTGTVEWLGEARWTERHPTGTPLAQVRFRSTWRRIGGGTGDTVVVVTQASLVSADAWTPAPAQSSVRVWGTYQQYVNLSGDPRICAYRQNRGLRTLCGTPVEVRHADQWIHESGKVAEVTCRGCRRVLALRGAA